MGTDNKLVKLLNDFSLYLDEAKERPQNQFFF